MMSGLARLEEIASVLELGVDRFLSKPTKADESKEYVALMLDR
jgi:DNA-binding response OmpR family regulator